MTDLVRIPVPGGLITHGGAVHEVVLKPPTYDDFLNLGEIETYGRSPDGTVFMVENSETLRAYIAKCLVEPKDPLALNQGGVKLARAVKGAVLDFFRDDASEAAPSPTSPTISSSSANPDASVPTPSAG